MEDEARKWCVTYTKHVKQKRKVYQDGFLLLHSSTHKARLFDECDKLLEIRILKNEEVVKSGETLTFNAYLVDIGDPEGDHKPIPNLNCQGKDKKITTQKFGLLHRQKFMAHSVSADNTKTSAEKNKAWQSIPSPSQKIIREFKKSEMNKYGAVQSSPDTTKSGVTEWQAMYTTQLTQKAKKYHDGILRLTFCGSQGRQVMLYDASKKLLDSRFLKKDEVIKSGEALTFDAHLVDIGEREGNHTPSTDLNAQGRNSNEVRQRGILYEQDSRLQANRNVVGKLKSELNKYEATQSSPDTTKSGATEWQVLYTTQITQKAKKYHDGILRLTFCGSQGRQVMLYDASRKLLGSRFLKKDEVIRSGESLAFDAHLVDIGEPEGNHISPADLNVQGKSSNECRQTGILYEQESRNQANRNVVRKWHALYTTQITPKTKKYHSGVLRLALCGTRLMQVTLLNEDGTTLSSKHLKFSEEVKSGSALELPKYLVEVGDPWICKEGDSQDNASLGKDLDSSFGRSKVGEIKVNNNVPTNKPLRNGDSQDSSCFGQDLDSSFGRSRVGEIKVNNSVSTNKSLRNGDSQDNSCLGKDMDSTFGRSRVGEIKVHNSFSTNKPLRNATVILSILKSSMPQESVTSIKKAPVEQCHASQSSNLVHFGLQDQVQGQLVQDSKKSRSSSEEHEDDSKALDEGTSTNQTYGTGIAKSNSIHNDLACKFIKLENSGDRGKLQAINSSDGDRKNVEVPETTSNLDEGPSFDLGF